jgi:hypothetical protein
MEPPAENKYRIYEIAIDSVVRASNTPPGPFSFSRKKHIDQNHKDVNMKFAISSRTSKDNLHAKAIIAIITSFLSLYFTKPSFIMHTVDQKQEIDRNKYVFYSLILSLVLFGMFYYI